MVGLGAALQAILGINTVVDGLACTPGTGLNVAIGPGSIYTQAATDGVGYGTLGTDANNLVKQGLTTGTTLAVPAPGSAGQSINYLVEVQYQDVDSVPLGLLYFNSSNPLVPYTGPGGSGATQNTVRKGVCAIQVKAGAAATTGSQTTPAADAGWTGIFVVTVANAAASIVTGNISQATSAPFIAVKLPQLVQAIQGGAYNFAVDSGTANHIIATINPAPAALTAGLRINVLVAATNTGAMDLQIPGLGTMTVNVGGAVVPAGTCVGGHIYQFAWNAAASVWDLASSPPVPGAPNATTTVFGVVQLASNAQAAAGSDTTHTLTPSNIASFLLAASTAVAGISPLATAAQAAAGTDTTHVLTPSSLFTLFSQSLGVNGYICLPGGGIIEWGSQTTTNATFSFPLTFPTSCLQFICGNTNSQGSNVDNAYGNAVSASQFFLATKQSGGGLVTSFPCSWIAIGK